MFTLNDKSMEGCNMAVQDNFLVRCELKQDVHYLGSVIHVEYRQPKVI
jgi:hypothetical protein